MGSKSIERVMVVVPNLNGEAYLTLAIDSLLAQDYTCSIIVVENASTDNSIKIIKAYGNTITTIHNDKNLGFAGGVNVGIRHAIDNKFDAIALFNNDAVADKSWLSELVDVMNSRDNVGIATSCIRINESELLDSTGEFYTTWGLPYPRGREQPTSSYQTPEHVFGASGGASLYRTKLFDEIGLFDETFFAYYEDTDLSFRAQLAGWKVFYTPRAVVHHRIGQTSKKMPGFTVYQTFKNLPMLFYKNVPGKLFWSVGVRFYFAYLLIYGNAVAHGNIVPALKGMVKSITLIPHSIKARRIIQKNRKASIDYIQSIIVKDLPPNQTGLRKLRGVFIGKNRT